jgi:hypothetical protein
MDQLTFDKAKSASTPVGTVKSILASTGTHLLANRDGPSLDVGQQYAFTGGHQDFYAGRHGDKDDAALARSAMISVPRRATATSGGVCDTFGA